MLQDDEVPFFSVGIPAWKTAYLIEAIESVLGQTFPNFELIVVNDASPCPVEEIVASFPDKRIRYYCNATNSGPRNMVDNWNRCVEYARGQYFMLLGDDDMLEPDCLAEFAALIGRYPDLYVYHCRSKIINELSEVTGYTDSRPEFETVYDAIWHRLKGWRMNFVSDFVYRREALVQHDGYYKLPMGWASDDITAFRLMTPRGMAHTQQPVFCYRQNQASMSTSGSVLLKLEAIGGERAWIEEFLRTEPMAEGERVLHANIRALLPGYIKRKQIGTMALFARKADLLRGTEFLRLGVSRRDIALAMMLKLKYALTRLVVNKR